jgi:hypothetical protein
MSNKEGPIRVVHFLGEFCAALYHQLIEDGKRWGDTWRHLPLAGQEDRIYAEINSYYAEWQLGSPIPWLKIAGLALIGWIREQHPDVIYPTGADHG